MALSDLWKFAFYTQYSDTTEPLTTWDVSAHFLVVLMFHLASWIYLFHRNTSFVWMLSLMLSYLQWAWWGRRRSQQRQRYWGVGGVLQGSQELESMRLGKFTGPRWWERGAYLKGARSPGWPAAGTAVQDVLTSETQFLQSFQLNWTGCTFFLDTTNWKLGAAVIWLWEPKHHCPLCVLCWRCHPGRRGVHTSWCSIYKNLADGEFWDRGLASTGLS